MVGASRSVVIQASRGYPLPIPCVMGCSSASDALAIGRQPHRYRHKKPRSTGGPFERGLSWGCGLLWAPRDDYGDRRKARMTELHDIHVIHRTVSTGNLKVTEGPARVVGQCACG